MNRRPSIFIASIMTLVLLLIATTQVQAQTMEPTLPNGCSTNSPTQNWINSVTSTPTSITVTLNDPPRPEGALIVICSPNDSNIYSENTIFTLFTPAAGSHTIHRIGWNQPTNAPPVKPATDYWVRIRDGTGYGGNYSEWYYIRTKAVSLTLNSAGADNTYQSGDEIEVTATFTESVTVTGSPRIPFTLGQETVHAVYDSGSPGTALEFSYTVVAGDLDTDGIEIAANALENHGGSTINLTSDSSVAAALEHGAVTASADHKVDGGAVTTATVPEFANDTMTLEVAENTASGSNVGTAVTAVDRDRDTLTYSLSGTDAGSFDIDSASGQITVGSGTSLNYEDKTSYSVTVGVTDSEDADGNSEATPTIDDTIAVTIKVTDVNEAPIFSEGAGPISRATQENKAATSTVGETVTATDEDGDTLAYSLSGTDAGSFDIDSANGQITVGSGTVLDYETTTSYSVTVGVTDGKNDNGDDESSPTVDATIVVEISVTNVEEPPEVPTNVTVTGASSSSLAVSWTAPSNQGARLDGYDVRYFQGTSSPSTESQWIDHAHSGTGTSTTISGLSANTAYQVQVRAKGDGNSAWVFASGVTERLPAPPEFANDNVTLAVVENTAAGSDVGVPVTASDVNGDTLTYSLSGTDAGSFDIDSASGQIKVGSGTALNYEAKNSYSVTVEVTDSEDANGNTQVSPTVDDTIAVVINVTNIEEPPGLPTNVTVTAVSKSSVSVSWTAPSDHGARLSGYDVRYYQGTSAPTDESQWINHAHSDTGTSTAISGLSANTDYQVQVRATGDGAGDWVTASGVTEALPTVPKFVSDSAVRTVAENLASGSSVGAVVVATDSDRDTLTYSLSGTDAGSFDINSATGQITVGSATLLDFEAKSRYSVTVEVTDGEDENGDPQVSPTIDDTIAVRIQLIDVNEEPEFSDGARTTRSVAENSPAGTLIGEPVAATDVDRGDRLTYTLSGTDRAAFTINSDNGQLAVAPNTTLDFETTPTLVVTVTATDAAGASVGITVVINLTDKSEPPKVPSGVTQRNTTDSSLTVLWDAPGRDDPPVVSYLLQYRESTGTLWTDVNTAFTSVNLTGLKDHFNYRVRVLATNADGASDWSKEFRVYTFPSSSRCSYPHQEVDLKTPPTSVAATYKSITVEAAIKSFAQFYLCKPDALGNYTRSSTPDIRANGQYKHTFTDVTAGSRHWVGGVTFAENGFSTLTIEWTAVDVPNNEPPVFDSLDGVRSVAENSPADTNIGAAFTATDPEGDTLQWTLGGTDAEYFLIEVNENEAQLKLAEDAKLDYETRRSYRLTLAVSDGLNHDAEADTTPDATLPITVSVTDVIEKPLAPTILRTAGQSGGGLLIRWSAPDNTGRPPIVDYDLQYRDAGTTNTFVDARYDGTGTTHTISSLGNRVRYEVQVRARNRDGDGEWSATALGSSGTPPNLPPAFDSESTVRVVEDNSIAGTRVGVPVSATEPEGENDTLVYSLSGPDASYFTVDNIGQLRVGSQRLRDRNIKSFYRVVVEVADQRNEEGDADSLVDDEIEVFVAVTDVHTDVGVCGRSEAAQRALLAATTGETDCADVTPEDLLMVGGVLVTGNDVTTLSRGDFRGVAMRSLGIENTKLTTLPAGLFEGVVDITSFSISQNADLTSVEAGLFDGLTFPIATMHFNENGLTSLPAGLFQGMRVDHLNMRGNADLVFTDGMFSGLTMGTGTLNLQNSGLSTLPAGLFQGIKTELDKLRIDLTPGRGSLGNPGWPFNLNLEMEVTPGELDDVRNVRIKLKEAAPEDVEVALTVSGGMEIRPSSVVIPQGEVVSDTAVLRLTGNGLGTVGLNLPAVPSRWQGVSGFSGSNLEQTFVQPPPAPELEAEEFIDEVKLDWSLQNIEQTMATGFEYRFSSDGGGTWSEWTTVEGGASATGVTVTGLSAGTEYRFEVRAVAGVFAGLATVVAATPRGLQTLPQIEDQFLVRNTAFSMTLPAATGGDPPYTYTLLVTLPAGLTFKPETRTLSGTPTTAGEWTLSYSATDAGGTVETRQFKVKVLPWLNRPPEGLTRDCRIAAPGTSIGRLELNNNGEATNFLDQKVSTLPGCPIFRDSDADPLTIHFSYENLPPNMRPHGEGVIISNIDTLVLFIATADRRTEGTITVTADDGKGGRLSRPLTLIGHPPPDRLVPRFEPDAAVADLQLEVGKEMEPLVLPAAVGGDRPPVARGDAPFELRYRTSVLPAGLYFDAATRTLSGAPEAVWISATTAACP